MRTPRKKIQVTKRLIAEEGPKHADALEVRQAGPSFQWRKMVNGHNTVDRDGNEQHERGKETIIQLRE